MNINLNLTEKTTISKQIEEKNETPLKYDGIDLKLFKETNPKYIVAETTVKLVVIDLIPFKEHSKPLVQGTQIKTADIDLTLFQEPTKPPV